MSRPAWFDAELFPFESNSVEVAECRVHFIDEGEGPVLLMLHGNPTWSFLYRRIIAALQDRFRCIALDYPGFGLSTAPSDYGFTAAEHCKVVEGFLHELALEDITLMVQDWGGPIGLGAAVRNPARFQALVVGNTWAWPVTGDRRTAAFSKLLGGRPGGYLVKNRNLFVNRLIPMGTRRRKLPKRVMDMYRGPFPTPESRVPVHVFPAQILEAAPFLEEVEQGLASLAHLPVLIVWGDRDIAFREPARQRWERTFPRHRTYILAGAGHYIQEDAGEEIALVIADWWPGLGASTGY